MRLMLAIAGLAVAPVAVAGEGVPGPLSDCALTGAKSVVVAGVAALRLSDVANCPEGLYEVVPGIMIEGEPIVRVRAGSSSPDDCPARGAGSVIANGEAVQRAGDGLCRTP